MTELYIFFFSLFHILFLCDKSLQSCLTLCDSINHSWSGSSVHGILQARILEWVAMPPSGDLPDLEIKPASLPSNLHWDMGSLLLAPPGKP